jgi:predicted HAD superfamily Cof-like phosphohydrolase
MKKSFEQRIAAMNAMYQLPANDRPSLPANLVDRLVKFKAILLDEVHEIDEIVKLAQNGSSPAEVAVALADVLGDITVYCRSEALKYGLPLEAVLDIIMDSNESKLGADGNPIYDANGKFLKGPNYWKPEPRIKALLEARGIQTSTDPAGRLIEANGVKRN